MSSDSKPPPASKPAAAAKPKFELPEPIYKDIPNSQIRKIIAARLQESKQTVPHYYLTTDIRVDALSSLRAELNATGASAEKPYKLSVNDFIIKASASALKDKPTVNSSWAEAAIRQYETVDISIAVMTDAGLMTPIIRDTDKKGLVQISAEMKDLAARAKAKKLYPHEFQGGTFTISNLGMYRISHFSAIINPPQSAILAIGAAAPRVVPVKASADGQLPFETATYMSVTMSCDHRVIDGATGAEWLGVLASYLEDPSKLAL